MFGIKGDLLDVVVPPLAESITDGTLAKFLKSTSFIFLIILIVATWHKSFLVIKNHSYTSRSDPGDRVELDEAIAQIETDKVLIYRFIVEDWFSFPSSYENDGRFICAANSLSGYNWCH